MILHSVDLFLPSYNSSRKIIELRLIQGSAGRMIDIIKESGDEQFKAEE
jgi:hypothetical protein